MQTYELALKSEASKSFMAQKAADSLDIDVEKKLTHNIKITADVKNDFNIGLIVGASGSGKTTLTKHIFGEDCFKTYLDPEKPIIEQFPKDLSYEDRSKILSGVGLTSVPCWIRPVKTLSNGQKARAEACLAMFNNDDVVLIDEWTSVVDRTIAKVMSHCVQKYARKTNKKIILCSCHYDVEEWLNPDWVIDCNIQKYSDYRGTLRKRKEKLTFEIKKVNRESWQYFSKYHYLSDKLPGGSLHLYGLFCNDNQIGFLCFANYVPKEKNKEMIFHFNRLVIHPDYVGLGLGIEFLNNCCELMRKKGITRIMGKFSSIPTFKSLKRNSKWVLKNISRDLKTRQFGKKSNGCMGTNVKSFRTKVKTYSFLYIGK